MNEGFKITEATRRVLDAMAELEIDTIYDAESGDFIFTYNLVEMVVLATKEEGGVCLSAEFVMDRYMDTIAQLWLEVLNRNGEVFTLQEPYPRVGRISREWLIDWEKPLPTEDLKAMLDVMSAACGTVADNLMNLRVPEEDDYN